ncbi:single-stranded-DNA-specific exonuclease RecJ [Candidatus Dojkabacteria bacterium]|nr:single-stranded-DNA-specific exonuclease RecJ [Candidatus Dojkabacteria bacterium]
MRWIEPKEIPDEIDVELKDFNPLLRKILYFRGIRSKVEAEKFLDPKLDDLIDPFLLYDVEKAVSKIEKAIALGNRIFIHGDFDADGICATAVLWDYLFRKRKADVLPYIPSRVDEGYGLSESSINAIIKKGGEMIITVDCGIRDVELIEKHRKTYKNKEGIDFIVTDHHKIGEKLPRYTTIVHPLHPKGKYPFGYLSGAAVAWKLVAAMEKKRFPDSYFWDKVPGLDLVALSTVADIMPITDENRIIVKQGLRLLRNSDRPGIKALAEEAKVSLADLNTYHLGYVIGPRINAAGRIGDATDALRLLTTSRDSSAKFLADKLGMWNKERQEITETILNEVREVIEREGSGKHLYFAYGNDWPEGIIGLVAGKIQEEVNRPVIVVTQTQKTARGSARSINGFNIIEAIEKESSLLESFGGHSLAAGFTVNTDNIEELKDRLEKVAESQLKQENFVKEVSADAVVNISDMNWETYSIIKKLAPFGYGNRRPVFWVKDAVVAEFSDVGDGKHLRLMVKGEDSGFLSCIYFGGGDWVNKISTGDTVELMGTLESNVWNGEEYLQFKIIDMVLT